MDAKIRAQHERKEMEERAREERKKEELRRLKEDMKTKLD
mgnify:CR=1 FL=1